MVISFPFLFFSLVFNFVVTYFIERFVYFIYAEVSGEEWFSQIFVEFSTSFNQNYRIKISFLIHPPSIVSRLLQYQNSYRILLKLFNKSICHTKQKRKFLCKFYVNNFLHAELIDKSARMTPTFSENGIKWATIQWNFYIYKCLIITYSNDTKHFT